jgi:VanZ family protein
VYGKIKPPLFLPLSLVWMSLIFIPSSLPGTLTGPDLPAFTVIKKIFHFLIFGVLSILYLNALRRRRPILETGFKIFPVSPALTVLYASGDEYHQSFSIGRHPSVRDVFIDTSGAMAFLGITFSHGLRNKRRVGIR